MDKKQAKETARSQFINDYKLRNVRVSFPRIALEDLLTGFDAGYDHAADEQSELVGWVTVEERLPEIGVRVLVMRETGFVDTDKLLGDKQGTGYGWSVAYGKRITAWMPIPKYTAATNGDTEVKI